VRWIEQYRKYVQDLEDYFSYVVLKPDLFNDLPFNGRCELSADECIRRLDLQVEALQRFDVDLFGRLEAAVKRHDLKKVAQAVQLSPDTVSDLVHRKVKHAKKTTMEKLEKHLPALE
jgi:hypothetical protein